LENAVLRVEYASTTIRAVLVVKRKTCQSMCVSFLIAQKKKKSNIALVVKNIHAD